MDGWPKIVGGHPKAVTETPGAQFDRLPNDRWRGSRNFATRLDPFTVIPREGDRDRKLHWMRVSEVSVSYNPRRISTFRVNYVDETSFDEARASRYPRGLVSTETQLQSGSINIMLFEGNTPKIESIPVVYRSPSKTYVEYLGMRNASDRTRAASSAPSGSSSQDVEIIQWDFTGLYWLAADIKRYIDLRLVTRWIMTSERSEEAGGYWRRTSTWGSLQVPTILSHYGDIRAT